MAFKKSTLEADRFLYEEERKDYCQVMKDVKAHYENHLFGKLNENPKLVWNYTRHFTRSNLTVDTLEHEGTKVSDDTYKANIINNFLNRILDERARNRFSTS